MTATLYTSQRVDRTIPRPIGDALRPIGPASAVVPVAGDDVPSSVDYAVRRAVAVLLVVLMVAVASVVGSALVGSFVDVGDRSAVAADALGVAPGARMHVAQPGDTLWAIADRYRGDVGHGRYLDALIDLNGGAVIQIGQAVRLP
jgi:LysM repeat protein